MAPGVRQSEKSRRTDEKVAHSAARAVRTVGVDQMALTRVAADAGFSSGAIYARCDDRSELVVLAWEKSFWPMLSAILAPLIDSVLSNDPNGLTAVNSLFTAAGGPDAVPDIGSAMEIIVASRRDEVIAEVVQRDIIGLFDDRGVGPSTDGANRQAVVAAASTLFGAALLNSISLNNGAPPIDPAALLGQFTQAVRTAAKPARPASSKTTPVPYSFPSTNDEIRDALISASEYVIARSGVHRATVSRIARRAGVSVGAIYGLYENKESLVSDCLDVLFPPQLAQDGQSWAQVFTARDQRAKVTEILSQYMAPSYSQWRRFRLECLLAARHSPTVAQQLASYSVINQEALMRAAEAAPSDAVIRPETGLSARSSVVGLSILEIVDPSICNLDWRWVPLP